MAGGFYLPVMVRGYDVFISGVLRRYGNGTITTVCYNRGVGTGIMVCMGRCLLKESYVVLLVYSNL